MTTIKDQVAVEATIAERAWTAAFGSLMAAVAGAESAYMEAFQHSNAQSPVVGSPAI